jgi:hypothetical protein
VKDEYGRDLGCIRSLLADLSGQVKEVLIEDKNEQILRYPFEKFKIYEDKIVLRSDIEDEVQFLSENIPVLRKKLKILNGLSESGKVTSEIYESLNGIFCKALDEMESEAKNILSSITRQARAEEESIKKLHLARIFLEIEYGMGNLKDEVYQKSIASILKEINNASYRKVNLQKSKEIIKHLTQSEDKSESIREVEAEALKPTPKGDESKPSCGVNDVPHEQQKSSDEKTVTRVRLIDEER